MTGAGPVAIELDGVLGDTRSLWEDWLASAGTLVGVDPDRLSSDRGVAARELDRANAGNWRTLLERFSEDRVAVYVRRDAGVASALRSLADAGRRVGVFTDAPEPLARIVLAHLGADRRVSVLETGPGACERLLAALGEEATVVRSKAELLAVVDTAGG